MTDWRPTPKQRAVLEAATEAGIRRSITAVCNEAGVSRDAFYKWLRDENFQRAWDDVWHGAIRRHLPGVVAATIERAQSGDVAAARLIAELAGVFKQKHEHSGTDGAPLRIETIIIEKPDGV